ncbi:hypothetical protein ACQP1O_10080 [Nocardia sp. CA-151230]|uniref:hypothetical protein n=1 Tax=Nocardia sp. CA-151230 TaxID=3239982 RepID=UPI003D90C13C
MSGLISGLFPLPELPDHPGAPAETAGADAGVGTAARTARPRPMVVALRPRLGRDPQRRPVPVHPRSDRSGARRSTRRRTARSGRSTLGEAMIGSAATTAARRGDDLDATLVLHARPLRPGVDLADTSRFGDENWILGPAQLQSHIQQLKLNFAALPEDYRLLAKHLFYSMLSGELPPGEKRPSITAIRSTMIEVKRLFCWLADRSAERGGQPLALAELTPADLATYREYLHATGSPSRRSIACAGVRCFWRYRRVLPDHLSFDPLQEVDDWSIPHHARANENKTDRIPEQILGPLITWALRFIDDFAPDILAAQQIWTLARDPNRIKPDRHTEPTALFDLLDSYIRRGRPLPGWGGAVNIKFLSDLTGMSRTRIYNHRHHVDRAAEIVGIAEDTDYDIDITGRLDGEPWIEAITTDHYASNSLAALTRMLQISCYTVISFFSGMRDSEVKHLRRGCVHAQHDADGIPYRWRITSTAFKGENAEGVTANWVVSPPAARAVAVIEQLATIENCWLFSRLPNSPGAKHKSDGKAQTTSSTNTQLNEFRDWINDYCASRSRKDPIPLVDGRPWTLKTSLFRRTLAWFIARQPGGSIAGAIQYRHMSIQMFEGYAGTSDSGFRAEVEAERALARGEHLLATIEAHQHTDYTGPAADEAARRLDDFGDHAAFTGTVITDPRRLARLMKKHDPAIYPGRYATCVFNPDKALCARTTDLSGASRPALGDCKPLDCNNVALTSDNLAALDAERASLLDQLTARPALPPMLHQRVTARAETIADYLTRHDNRS